LDAVELDLEEVVMQIITNSGDARSRCLTAIRQARQGHLSEAESCLNAAKESLSQAHAVQTQLIQNEIKGHAMKPTLIMIHAQDHLMNALTVRDLAVEMIEIIKQQNN
jgi:PTS system cellobiose-specific IIA component